MPTSEEESTGLKNRLDFRECFMVELVEMEKQERIVAGGPSDRPTLSAVEMVEGQRPTGHSLRISTGAVLPSGSPYFLNLLYIVHRPPKSVMRTAWPSTTLLLST